MSMMVSPYRFAAAPAAGFGSHRYWRIFIAQNSGNTSFTSVSEIEFHSTVGGADITGSGTALSGGSGADQPGGAVTNAFNNNTLDTWARNSTTNTWVGYDFLSPVTVAEFSITAPQGAGWNQCAQSFTLDYSDDGSSWTTATGGTFTAYGWLSSQTRTYPETAPAAGFHRFWRFFCETATGGAALSLVEMELRAAAGGADQTTSPGSNTGNSSGRAIFSADTGGNEGFRLWDNSTPSSWFVSTGANQWNGFVSPSPISVAEVAITISSRTDRAPSTFRIERSDDHDKVGGGTWTQAQRFTGQTWTANEQKLFSI